MMKAIAAAVLMIAMTGGRPAPFNPGSSAAVRRSCASHRKTPQQDRKRPRHACRDRCGSGGTGWCRAAIFCSSM